MPTYYIQGYITIDPPAHADDVMDSLNRYGAGLSSGSADRGSSHFRVGESVEAATDTEAIAALASRLAHAVERRRLSARVQRFAVGPLVAEYVSEWLPDDEFGMPQLGRVRHLAQS